MALYLLQNVNSKTVKSTQQLVVAAESVADAQAIATSYFNGDSGWAGAIATELVDTETWDSAGSCAGWKFKISVTGGAAQGVDPIEVEVVGAAADDLDAVAGKLVSLLNATEITAATYVAPDLTVAAIADDIGDATVRFYVYPAAGDTSTSLAGLLLGAGGITDEGIAAADLVIELVADTEVKPLVVKEA